MTTDRIHDLERSPWEMFSFMGHGPGGRVLDTPTRLVIESPVPRPPYNAVFRFYDEGDRPLRDQAVELLTPMTDRGVTPVWLVHPTTSSGVRDALADIGLVCADVLYGMWADIADVPEPPPIPDGIEVIETMPDEANPWLEMVSWRYGLAEDSSAYLRDAYVYALQHGTRGWIAMLDGRPVSKAVLHLSHGVAGIYGVGTTEEGRGRGLATLLCSIAVAAGLEDGADRTVLHSTPMARSLYGRMGYVDVAEFEFWAMPGALHL